MTHGPGDLRSDGRTGRETGPQPQSDLPPRVPLRKRLKTAAKWTLTLLVLAFVAWQAAKLWRKGSAEAVELRFGWLAFSGLIYAAGWLPTVWFWRLMLARMGDPLPWPAVARAYYCGHLGKYVPGKALVPVIRGQLVAAAGGRFRTGALSAVYETLVMMAAGAAIAAALAPALLPPDTGRLPEVVRAVVERPEAKFLLDRPLVTPVLVLVATAVALPVVARLFSAVAAKVAPAGDAVPARSVGVGVLAAGFAAYAVAWPVHGLSLWATLRGVGADVSPADLAVWTAAVAAATTIGFAVLFAPGGVGVREGLLMAVLADRPGINLSQAVAAAFLLRAVWLAAEAAIAAVLYYGVRPGTPRSDQEAHASRSP